MQTQTLEKQKQARTGLAKGQRRGEAKPAGDIMTTTDQNADLGNLVVNILSGTYVLMVKTQAVHWNVSGPLFKSVHDLTEDQYNDMFAAIDVLAERIRALGLKAPMNYGDLEGRTELTSFEPGVPGADMLVATLARDHDTLARELAAGAKVSGQLGDPATEDLMIERLRVHQKHAWMLRAMIDS